MDEPITVTCPHCRRSLSVPAQNLGQRAECSLCGRMFTVQTGGAPNPPAAPSDVPGAFSPGSQPPVQPITPLMAQHLLATRPWVLFLSILGFIGCGLMVVGALSMMGMGGRPRGLFRPPPDAPGLIHLVMAGLPGLIHLVMAGLSAATAWLLFKYAAAIKASRYSGSSGYMELALRRQKSFWRFMGIMTIVVMAIYLALVLIELMTWSWE